VPTAARVAEILNPNLDLRDRVGRLTIRLTYGMPAAAVDLARECGSRLLRGDYCALVNATLSDTAAIEVAPDAALLACLGKDADKLAVVRAAVEKMKARRHVQSTVQTPVLEPYVA
jgi:helicase